MMETKHTPGPWVAHEWSYAARDRFDDNGNKYWGIEPEQFHSDANYGNYILDSRNGIG